MFDSSLHKNLRRTVCGNHDCLYRIRAIGVPADYCTTTMQHKPFWKPVLSGLIPWQDTARRVDGFE